MRKKTHTTKPSTNYSFRSLLHLSIVCDWIQRIYYNQFILFLFCLCKAFGFWFEWSTLSRCFVNFVCECVCVWRRMNESSVVVEFVSFLVWNGALCCKIVSVRILIMFSYYADIQRQTFRLIARHLDYAKLCANSISIVCECESDLQWWWWWWW